MALLAYQQVQITGTTVTMSAANAGGDTVLPNQRGFVRVKNGSGAGITVTVTVPGSAYGQARPDIPVAVAAGAEAVIGPVVPDLADPATGLVSITYSAATSVTVAAVRV